MLTYNKSPGCLPKVCLSITVQYEEGDGCMFMDCMSTASRDNSECINYKNVRNLTVENQGACLNLGRS